MATPLVLFGAFDRHNFGDLLFPHVAAALLPEHAPLFAGLARRDLRVFGGHQVEALPALLTRLGDRPISLIHVGGELLTCSAWEAAVMLLPPDAVQPVIARLDAQPIERSAWAREQLGMPDEAPYVVSPMRLHPQTRVVHAGVGGMGLDACPPALRAEVLGKLARSAAAAVRDRRTLAQLDAAGIDARLVPDPAAMVAELFGEQIARSAGSAELAQLRAVFPRGYLAVQFSADFGDDATLALLARELGRCARITGLGIVLFRAGAAPWHDSLEAFDRLAVQLPPSGVQRFASLEIWDICALIAGSSAYCGSSLHGRIVAMAYALPRLNLLHPSEAGRTGKTAAYAGTWDEPDMPGAVALHEIEPALQRAMAVDRARLRRSAVRLAERYRAGFAALTAMLH